ncbi:hypothetical protein [Nostoc sp. MG11]|uniref:hypothetical protein n=1 Tax=Nostoc sp. MG11 TaxID=2721166 RepID=UPI0018662683|nr:hypothetical protein [Nostoc sp. MG11]
MIIPQIQSQRYFASALGCSKILLYDRQQVQPKLRGLPKAVPKADSVSSAMLVFSIKRAFY